MRCKHLLTTESTCLDPVLCQSQAALLFEFVHRDQLQRFFKLYGSTSWLRLYLCAIKYRNSEQDRVTCTLSCGSREHVPGDGRRAGHAVVEVVLRDRTTCVLSVRFHACDSLPQRRLGLRRKALESDKQS